MFLGIQKLYLLICFFKLLVPIIFMDIEHNLTRLLPPYNNFPSIWSGIAFMRQLIFTHALMPHSFKAWSNEIDQWHIFVAVFLCNSITCLKILVCYKSLISSLLLTTNIDPGDSYSIYKLKFIENHYNQYN